MKPGLFHRMMLLIVMGLYLFSPYSFKEMSEGCACGCGESAYCNYCLQGFEHKGSVSVHSKCRCCKNSIHAEISGTCNCHNGEEQPSAKSLEIIIPRFEMFGLLNEAGRTHDLIEGVLLPAYKVPPMKPPPTSDEALSFSPSSEEEIPC
jgi:hypothetical protein